MAECFDQLKKWASTSSILISLTALSFFHPCHPSASIDSTNSLTDGQILSSPAGVFNLGFFPIGSAGHRYVGIWHGNFSIQTIVWLANRENPMPNSFGSLAIHSDGNLAVFDGRRRVLWSSNTTLPSTKSIVALSDFGNLMLNNSGGIAWESFDHPADTYLAGMKIGLDLSTNSNQLLSSWKSADDPSPGRFSLGVNPSAQLFIWEDGRPRWRSGQWNGQIFIGIPDMVFAAAYGFKLSISIEGSKIYYSTDFNSSHRWVLSPNGTVKHLLYFETSKIWLNLWEAPASECEKYNRCGNYGICADGASPICSCLKGFMPRSETEWSDGNWSGGCARKTPLQCEGGGMKPDLFYLMQGIKLPDYSGRATPVVNLKDCGDLCLRNCSCTAYSFVDAIGCMIWGSDLADMNIFASGENDMYLRLAASEFDQDVSVSGKKKKEKRLAAFISVIIGSAGVFLIGCIIFWFCRFKRKGKEICGELRKKGMGEIYGVIEINGEREDDKSSEIPHVSLSTILAATEGFSHSNLLGKGGFGPVYKGTLSGGGEIAVKKLSQASGQGMEEFKNEVILISKLQHRNLVRLLGFCTENEDQILVYEYMPNKSLDYFIFEPNKKGQLDWKARFTIIEGIARGLLYLHRDSRLRIIHRDLKASNILLDAELNPKISDFGLARIFGSDNNETTTKRVVGTYGYMSPEYAMQGLFSVKSDVYSFGVLLLEIVSGKRNSTFCHPELNINLLSYAWNLWIDENVMELVDPSVSDSCVYAEVSRCVYLALSCVQDRANDRPTMSSAIVMLESGVSAHPAPNQPTFSFEAIASDGRSQSPDGRAGSAYDSITSLTGR